MSWLCGTAGPSVLFPEINETSVQAQQNEKQVLLSLSNVIIYSCLFRVLDLLKPILIFTCFWFELAYE